MWFCHTAPTILSFVLEESYRVRESEISVCWLAPQMAPTARAGLSWSQKQKVQSKSHMGDLNPSTWAISYHLPVSALAGSLEWSHTCYPDILIRDTGAPGSILMSLATIVGVSNIYILKKKRRRRRRERMWRRRGGGGEKKEKDYSPDSQMWERCWEIWSHMCREEWVGKPTGSCEGQWWESHFLPESCWVYSTSNSRACCSSFT